MSEYCFGCGLVSHALHECPQSTDVQGVGLVKDHKFRPWLWATSPPKERLPCSGGQFNQGASPSSTENIQQDIDVVANPIPRDVGSLISTDISGRMTTLSSTKGKEKVVEPSASGVVLSFTKGKRK
ncbi:hypothetical protein ACOSP7_016557 [Xanthoceras sorbifolium]